MIFRKAAARSSGFTLIELIAVLLVVAIMAVSSVPRLVDMADEARASAISNVAASVTAQASMNVLAGQLSQGRATSLLSTATACSDLIVGPIGLVGNSLPGTMRIAQDAVCNSSTTGLTIGCTIQDKVRSHISAQAFVICTAW